MKSHRAGFTLIELLVVLAIMVVSLSVAGVALLDQPDRSTSQWGERLHATRSRVMTDGLPRVVWPDSAHLDDPALVLPDGRVVRSAATPEVDEAPRDLHQEAAR